ncbi:DUF551 domain-containing protein [Escherichia coli]|nr:DUF551 domain-containing protein [Escherichia coli]NEY67330.1 DUF551 domain-containing protein [Escherichia coli]
MTTFTDKELIKEIKERIGSLDVRDNIERRAYEIALASLEAEPVAYIFKHPAGKLFWALTDESNKDQSDVIPVYAAPPVPVVPAALPENDDEDGHDIDYLEPSEVYSLGRTAGWNACRAAMLHGAEPVSQTYKLNELSGNSPGTPDSWISCSERMPNDKQYVWCWGKSYGWTECNTFEGYYDWSRNKWWAVTDDGEEPASKVTHWMPLPEPPQEAE